MRNFILVLVPNLITSFNFIFGLASLALLWRDQTGGAAVLILTAGMCDWLDGYTARKLGASSTFGLWFDSFADLVSFGFASALLVFQKSMNDFGWPGVLWVVIYILAVFIRLIRYSMEHKKDEAAEYKGVPCPVAGCYFGLIILIDQVIPFNWSMQVILIFVPAIAFPVLMLSVFPFPKSLKFQ